METAKLPKEVLSAYSELKDIREITPYGGGHINSTFKVTTAQSSFILQKINIHVFTRPVEVMSNIIKVAAYLHTREYQYQILEPLPTKENKPYTLHEGEYWRTFPFIENTVTVEKANEETQAFEERFLQPD